MPPGGGCCHAPSASLVLPSVQKRELCAFQIPVSVVKCMRARNLNTTRPGSTQNTHIYTHTHTHTLYLHVCLSLGGGLKTSDGRSA